MFTLHGSITLSLKHNNWIFSDPKSVLFYETKIAFSNTKTVYIQTKFWFSTINATENTFFRPQSQVTGFSDPKNRFQPQTGFSFPTPKPVFGGLLAEFIPHKTGFSDPDT